MDDKKISQGLKALIVDKRLGIIYGVLKRLSINRWSNDYDDYFQEGCLAFAEAHAAYPADHADDRFAAYAFQRVYWRLLDRLRHQNNLLAQKEWLTCDDGDESNGQPQLGVADPAIDRAVTTAYFRQLARQCTQNQRHYLDGRLNHGWSDREIADHYQVTPAAVYQWKQGLIEKARRIDYN